MYWCRRSKFQCGVLVSHSECLSEAEIPAGKYRPALNSRISREPQRLLHLCIHRTETDGVIGKGGALWDLLRVVCYAKRTIIGSQKVFEGD